MLVGANDARRLQRANEGRGAIGAENTADRTIGKRRIGPVSYTHLDVYKRQM